MSLIHSTSRRPAASWATIPTSASPKTRRTQGPSGCIHCLAYTSKQEPVYREPTDLHADDARSTGPFESFCRDKWDAGAEVDPRVEAPKYDHQIPDNRFWGIPLQYGPRKLRFHLYNRAPGRLRFHLYNRVPASFGFTSTIGLQEASVSPLEYGPRKLRFHLYNRADEIRESSPAQPIGPIQTKHEINRKTRNPRKQTSRVRNRKAKEKTASAPHPPPFPRPARLPVKTSTRQQSKPHFLVLAKSLAQTSPPEICSARHPAPRPPTKTLFSTYLAQPAHPAQPNRPSSQPAQLASPAQPAARQKEKQKTKLSLKTFGQNFRSKLSVKTFGQNPGPKPYTISINKPEP